MDASTAVAVDMKKDVPSFLRGSIDLKRVLRDVSKQSKTAIEALVGLLSSEDERVRANAAKTLLELQVTLAKEVNNDQITRLIAELRWTNNPKTLVPLDDDDDMTPIVDFSQVREIPD